MRNLTRRQLLAGMAGLLPSLSGCQVAPGTGKSGFNLLSAEDERRMGRETHPQILKEFGGAYGDAALQAYVAGIGQRLVKMCETPEAEFRFTVLDSDVVNAMALPGGYIYVTRGLLALTGNEAELAGVIGHEIGHVLARHTALRVSQSQASNVFAGILGIAGAVAGVPGVGDVAQYGAAAYLQSFSREQESEADHLGLRYLSHAGWDARAMATMLERLRERARLDALMAGRSPDSVDKLDFMASHPRTLDRVHAAMQEALGAPPKGRLGTDALLDRIDGMIHGDDPAKGVVRDRAFLHPAAGFRFEVPAGFRLVNGDRAVVARDATGAIIIFDGVSWRGPDLATYVSGTWLPQAEMVERLQVNGMDAVTATARGRTKQGQVDMRAVAVRFDRDTIYRFAFLTPPRQTATLDAELRRTAYSFRRLSPEERAAVRPWRLQVVRAQAGDTVEGLAARMALPAWQGETFRVLNGLRPSEQPQPGKRVKLVV